MPVNKAMSIAVEPHILHSKYLAKDLRIDCYSNNCTEKACDLLLINDGQDLLKMELASLLSSLFNRDQLKPLVCVGIHAGADRLHEYGTSGILDFAGRGVKAEAYQQFVVYELLPFIREHFKNAIFYKVGVAGFSMGGLSAIDTALNYPIVFSIAAAFSGSFWWRKKDIKDGYDEEQDRIIHQKVRSSVHRDDMQFYFTTGSLDETSDRNSNGVIDSIDDTLDLIKELKAKGYNDITYVNYKEGRHDTETWRVALEPFLLWGWGK
jgi:iron(III)-enterobactin esterase